MAVLIRKTAVSHCILQSVGHGRTGVLKRSDHKDVKMETGGGRGGGDAESCDSSASLGQMLTDVTFRCETRA